VSARHAAAVVVGVASLLGCGPPVPPKAAPVEPPAEPAAQLPPTPPPIPVEPPVARAPLSSFEKPVVASETREGGLLVFDYVAGEGFAAELGDYVEVHYVLMLDNGVAVDSSHEREQGLQLVLGETGVIPGFAAGLIGVRRGMLRKIVVPPALGYGERELANIPANSTLTFYIEVIVVN
jgi:hypothetical protein